MTDPLSFQTRCIHAGEAPDPATGAHGVPLYQNVTYAFRSFAQVEAMEAGQAPHFTYSPRGNPTVRCLELKLADLEGAEAALATASGMAAISATLLTLAGNGGHVVAADEVYFVTREVLVHELPAHGARVSLVPIADLAAVEAAIGPDTRAIYVEPFSNPLLNVADLPALAAIAGRRGIPLVVDNTFLSPALLRPIAHGADLVLHSATKYLSGFGQTQGGVVAGRADLVNRIRDTMIRLGGQMPPFAAWLLLQGVKTLPLRVRIHAENAGRVARLLAAHPVVDKVHYPGLPEDRGHALAVRLLGEGGDRFGGMVSFSLTGGRPATAAFIDTLSIATIAVSLGDASTLVWPWHDRDLIRLSVGIEDGDDLEHDIARALAAAAAAAAAAAGAAVALAGAYPGR
jgi:cystathionine beta-lyase/cystathionine gamma-synthase